MSPSFPGSFTSLNNSLNPFASPTTTAPPDTWPYSPAYDLTPHLNLLSPPNPPYTSAPFGAGPGGGNGGGAYSYAATMLPQHDATAALFSTPATAGANPMRVHAQDYMNPNAGGGGGGSSPPTQGPGSLTRTDYQTMVATHSPPTHLGNSGMSEDDHTGGCLADKYAHEQADYGQQQQPQQQPPDQKPDYGIHSPQARQAMKEHQVMVKNESSGQQNYVQLPPFLN